MIINPSPITAGTFNGFWVSNVTYLAPLPGTSVQRQNGFFAANLLPYDGTHLLATDIKQVVINNVLAKRAADSVFASMLDNLANECKRQANNTSSVERITVSALNPAKKNAAGAPIVSAFVQFDSSNNSTHQIKDCYALAGTDSTFAGVFNAAMGEIARLAGLTIA